ncbi:hypothetical protein AAFF_G00112510 [Aldrovandia affinis]|uniref:Uncharacterized protein n=1 Tax=Aldrovandia affinis TaxID=143900 RepID=A0AAD7WAI5_9TELE|nr:hypothetical protein AAFF_G00112510 [Aldrovandia affinis]
MEDEDYHPSEDEEDDELTLTGEPETSDLGSVKDKKYIVFGSQLLVTVCGAETPSTVTRVSGTAVYVTQPRESCGHVREWASQPKIGRVAAGNVLLSAAILASGSLPTKAVATIHHNTW